MFVKLVRTNQSEPVTPSRVYAQTTPSNNRHMNEVKEWWRILIFKIRDVLSRMLLVSELKFFSVNGTQWNYVFDEMLHSQIGYMEFSSR